MTTELFRSLLFAPGHEEDKIRKALQSEADQVVADLEDAVPPEQKDKALKTIIKIAQDDSLRPFYVRINALTNGRTYGDICQLMRPGIKGFVVPKMETAAQCHILNWLTDALEKEHALADTDIIPVIETAKGFMGLQEMCRAAGRIRRLSFGSWDFCADTDRIWDASEEAIVAARHELVTVSRAAELDAPIDTSYPVLSDTEGLRRSVVLARKIGYQGKACLHPAQLEQVNAGFSPSSEEYDLACAIVKEFRNAQKKGIGAITVEGRFVDHPIFCQAQKVVEKMRLIEKSKPHDKPQLAGNQNNQ